MKIILNQAEIEDAVRACINERVTILDDQIISVAIAVDDNDGIVAEIFIGKEEEQTEGNKPAATKPVKTRTRRVNGSAQATASTAAQEPESVAIDETKNEDPDAPWSTEAEAEAGSQVVEEEAATSIVVGTKEEAPVVQATGLKIFPDVASSAPVVAKDPTPTSSAKSLFANLTKPVHDAPRI